MKLFRVLILPEDSSDHPQLSASWLEQGFELVPTESAHSCRVPDGTIWLASAPPPRDFDPYALQELHLAAGRQASIAVIRMPYNASDGFTLSADAGLLPLGNSGAEGFCWSPVGFALLESVALKKHSNKLEQGLSHIMRSLLQRGSATGLPIPGPVVTSLKEMIGSRTLFLDRDGVVNERIPGDYVRRSEDFHFLPGVLDAIGFLRASFDRVVVVTNQQGIGKGWMSEADLDRVHGRMVDAFLSRGVRLDGIYHCPGLAADRPVCRKPLPGMALQAMVEYPEIEPSRSVMVGDSLSDIQFGRRLGMYTVKVGDSCGMEDLRVDTLADLPKSWGLL